MPKASRIGHLVPWCSVLIAYISAINLGPMLPIFCAGVAHGQRERGGFGGVQPAKINGHEQRGHLVIGNFSGGEFADEFLDLFRREDFSFALGFDERKKIHGNFSFSASNLPKF